MRTTSVILFLVVALSCGCASAQSSEAAAQAAPADQSSELRAPSAVAAKRPGDASKSWTINFDRTAKSDGQIKLLVWQNDQDAPTEVLVPVTKGQTENSIALQTRDLFRDILGVKDFETNVAKGNVYVRVKHGERRFSVQVGENTAEGVRIELYAR